MANSMGRLFFCLCIICSALCYGSDAVPISFNFPPQTDIRLSADASISNNAIQLTLSQSSLGWATYSNFLPSQALESFSTHFQFSMAAVNGSGEGLTFFIAPSDFQSSDADHGEWLGLFEPETDGNSTNRILAVEFDTYEDDFDPDDNHVGIDINSIRSKVTFPVSDLFDDAVLNNGEKWDAWVEYSGPLQQLQVFLLQTPGGITPSRPINPVLWYGIDLSQFLAPVVKVGLSASTGVETETHTVYAWSFSCQDSSSAAVTLTPAPIRKKKHHNFITIIIVFIIAIIVAIMLVRWWRRSSSGGLGKKAEEKLNRPSLEAVDPRAVPESVAEESDDELDKRLARAIQSARKFSYDDLRAATNNFSPDEEIGEGGFGKVYRGTLPSTNQAVAVKRMNQDSNQGQEAYESEVIINGKLTHRNLVEFLGWCHRKGERLLVYELLPNGSLDKYIFEDPKDPLEWDKRYIIARDVASALVYLHQDRRESVLHRDIKAENVMLASDFRAKLGDFGLATALRSEDEDRCYNSGQYGTFGYVAPEYATERKFSLESDVFSFGALALAIACGRRPVDKSLVQHSSRLVEWVWHLHGKKRILDAADEKLDGNFNRGQMERLMLVGLWCSHHDPNARPSMKQVLDTLEREDGLPSIPRDYPRPSRLIFASPLSGSPTEFLPV